MVQHAIVPFDNDQLNIIRSTVAKGTNPDQFKLFIEVCKYHGLSPFARQIYAVVRNAKQSDGSYEKQMTIQTSIDGYRLLAERSGKYSGQLGPHWCDESGEWKDVWLSDKPPAAARVGVLRKDFAQPTWGVAKYKSYAQSSPLWTKMPDVMLAKCAESLALRKAFPAEMSGIYTAEEMQQADSDTLPTVAPLHAMTVEADTTHTKEQSDLASPQHLSSIRKLCERLGKGEPENLILLNTLEARTLIQALTAEYNAQKQIAKDESTTNHQNASNSSQEGQETALQPSDLNPIRAAWATAYGIPEAQIEERFPKYIAYLLKLALDQVQAHHLKVIERDIAQQIAKTQQKAS
jgi:phage recombination protein Bet